MDLEGVLNDFPTAERVDYLDTANIGLVPTPVIESLNDISTELARGGSLTLNEEKENMIYEGLREEGAKLLGCDGEDIAIFNSTTEALNSIAWSLELEEGKVISTDLEFPSVTYPWLRIARKENIKVKLINSVDWSIPVDELLNEIDEDTRVVVLSHVEFLTGQKFDIEKIAKQSHQVGAILVIDGIQAAGYIPIDVKEMDVDIYITGSYKWLSAPFGAAIAYISKKICGKLEPALVGWRSPGDIWRLDCRELRFASTAKKFEYSTSAYNVKLALTESIKYLRRIGIKNIYHHNMKITKTLIKELSSIEGLDIITPENRGSIVTFKLQGKDSKEVAELLHELERPIEFSIRLNMLRISPHLYNSEQDILYFVENLRQALRRL